MKKLIVVEPVNTIDISKLQGNEIVAYRCKSEVNAVAILAKLNPVASEQYLANNIDQTRGYAFVPLNNSNSCARYWGASWHAAVASASKARQLFVFDSQADLIDAIYHRKF